MRETETRAEALKDEWWAHCVARDGRVWFNDWDEVALDFAEWVLSRPTDLGESGRLVAEYIARTAQADDDERIDRDDMEEPELTFGALRDFARSLEVHREMLARIVDRAAQSEKYNNVGLMYPAAQEAADFLRQTGPQHA